MIEDEAASEGTFLALASCLWSAVSKKQVLVCERGLQRPAKSQDNQKHVFGALYRACIRAVGY